jgi:hypothetical protein
MTQADRVHSTPPINTPIPKLLDLADELSREVEHAPPDLYIVKVRRELMARVEAALRTAGAIDPIYSAIDNHRAAYAAYDAVADGPDDENDAAFSALDSASQRLLLAKTSTMAGLIALLRYMSPLLQAPGAPALPLEVPFGGRWPAAFGTFCANVAGRLTALSGAESAVTPEYVDHVAEAIVSATAPLFDDFEMARAAARAVVAYFARGGQS